MRLKSSIVHLALLINLSAVGQVKYNDCISGIKYYIQTNKKTKTAILTIDLKQAQHGVYLSDVRCFFYPVNANSFKLGDSEIEYPITQQSIRGEYTQNLSVSAYPHAAGLWATKMKCTCNISGGKSDDPTGKLVPDRAFHGEPVAANQVNSLFLEDAPDSSNPHKHDTLNNPIGPRVVSSLLSVEFPDSSLRNNNSTIGDFCCTGQTATVYNNEHLPIGYVYFFDFENSRTIYGNKSIASKLSILVSGIPELNNVHQDRVKNRIDFTTEELYKGAAKVVQAGGLYFKITILEVRKFTDPRYYYLDSIKARAEVSNSRN